MNNDAIERIRYRRWYRSRVLYTRIRTHLTNGGYVMVATSTTYGFYTDPDRFQCRRNGVYLRRGEQWDLISHCIIRFGVTITGGQVCPPII